MSKTIYILSGILISVLILFIIISFVFRFLFHKKVTEEINDLIISNKEYDEKIIRRSDLDDLPDNVRKWLEYSQIIGKEKVNTVRLQQKAELRLNKDQSWMPVEAEQYFTTNHPGFIWKASIKPFPFLHISGRDKYYKGKGGMLIKVLSLITVANSKGEEIDQGTLLRYLAEIVWFPTAAINDYIQWEELNSSSARATMSYGGITASGIFNFNKKGEVINFVAERYMEKDDQYELETWSPVMSGYQEINGIMIPTRGEVIWKLETGDFKWFKFTITDIDYYIDLSKKIKKPGKSLRA